MSAAQKIKHQNTKRYTYTDYCEWDDDERWEIIDGVPYAMAAPTRKHQSILRDIALQIGPFFRGKTFEMFFAPFDVRLNADTFENTVVQPDMKVVWYT